MYQSAIDSNFKIFSKNYVFDPRPNLPFQITAKRYWIDSGSGENTDTKTSSKPDGEIGDASTLIFTNTTGSHKEHWEPIIRRLFEQQRRPGACSFKIEDAWSLDAPNDGDAAVINQEVFTFGYETVSCEDYGRSIHAFLAGLGTGVDVDFSKRKLVTISHSMGTAAMMFSGSLSPRIKFSSMHVIEPVISGNYEHGHNFPFVVNIEKRRDVWKSTEGAYKSFKDRSTWRRWDDRTLRIYVHCSQDLPAYIEDNAHVWRGRKPSKSGVVRRRARRCVGEK